jgi:hypothetical protein
MERIRIISEILGETFGRFDPVQRIWKSEGLQEMYELEAWEMMEKLSRKGYYIVRAPASIVKRINDEVAEEDREIAEEQLRRRMEERVEEQKSFVKSRD